MDHNAKIKRLQRVQCNFSRTYRQLLPDKTSPKFCKTFMLYKCTKLQFIPRLVNLGVFFTKKFFKGFFIAHIVSEINGDFSRQSQRFSTAVCLTPLKGFPYEFYNDGGLKKNYNDAPTRMSKSVTTCMCIRLDNNTGIGLTDGQTDGRTDWRTELVKQYRALHVDVRWKLEIKKKIMTSPPHGDQCRDYIQGGPN